MRRLPSLAAAIALVAVVACLPPAATSTSELPLEVEKPPALIPSVTAPAYPRALLEATPAGATPVTGRVVVRLTVRADGTVDPATVAVVSASDSAFIAPVLAVVPTWRFLPAEVGPVGGPFRRVAQEIQLPVSVAPPSSRR